MTKTQWNQVVAATTARRNFADDKFNRVPRHASGAVANIVMIANNTFIKNIVGTNGSQQTFAIGFVRSMTGFNLIVSLKGVSSDVVKSVEKMRRTLLPQATVYDVGSVESGLHAEMAIVRLCVGQLGISKAELSSSLQVACIGKAVCRDCAGWMNKHGIGHCSVVQAQDGVIVQSEAGGVSTMMGGTWKNPLTLANFAGGNDLNYYIKDGKSIHKPTFG